MMIIFFGGERSNDVRSLISFNAHPSKASKPRSWRIPNQCFPIHFNNSSLVCSTWTRICEVAGNSGAVTSVGCGRSRIEDTRVYIKKVIISVSHKIENKTVEGRLTWYREAAYASLTPRKTAAIFKTRGIRTWRFDIPSIDGWLSRP